MDDFPGCNSESCKEHSKTTEQITQLQQKLQVIENNTSTVAKLSGRVGMLMTIMSLGTVAVLGGAVYTFTALGNFKEDYAKDRISMQQQLTSMQKENITALNSGLAVLDANIDTRIDGMSDRLVKLEVALSTAAKK